MSEPGVPPPMAEGRLAARNGELRTVNPYAMDTDEHDAWQAGYEGQLDMDEGGEVSDFA